MGEIIAFASYSTENCKKKEEEIIMAQKIRHRACSPVTLFRSGATSQMAALTPLLAPLIVRSSRSSPQAREREREREGRRGGG